MHMDRHMYRYIHITQALAFATEAAREFSPGGKHADKIDYKQMLAAMGCQLTLERINAEFLVRRKHAQACMCVCACVCTRARERESQRERECGIPPNASGSPHTRRAGNPRTRRARPRQAKRTRRRASVHPPPRPGADLCIYVYR